MKVLNSLLLVPLDDTVVFPNMNITAPVDVGDEERVLLVPRHEGEYAKVGTVADVAERVRLPGSGSAGALVGPHRGTARAAHTGAQGPVPRAVEAAAGGGPPAGEKPRVAPG